MYTEEERKTIIDTFENRDKNVQSNLPKHLVGLEAIADTHLFERIQQDTTFASYGALGMLPRVFDAVYSGEYVSVISNSKAMHGTRGLNFTISTPRDKFVVKKAQSEYEKEIARFAESIGLGPKQYESLSGIIVEEFIDAPLFTEITSIYEMKHAGEQFAKKLREFHNNGFIYNDGMLCDDYGKSHLFIRDGEPILFDYGVSIDFRNHPNITLGQASTYLFSEPGFGSLWHLNPEEFNKYAIEVQQNMIKENASAIIEKDDRLFKEGLFFADTRMGSNLVKAFSDSYFQTLETLK